MRISITKPLGEVLVLVSETYETDSVRLETESWPETYLVEKQGQNLFFNGGKVRWYTERRRTEESRTWYTLAMAAADSPWVPRGRALGIDFLSILATHQNLIPSNILKKLQDMEDPRVIFGFGSVLSSGGGLNTETRSYSSGRTSVPILYVPEEKKVCPFLRSVDDGTVQGQLIPYVEEN